ncbi:MAG: hypoxanthine phosphoribosyltransferase [Bacteroidota bacterium]
MIQLHDRTFEIYLTEQQVQERVHAIGRRLNELYAGKDVVFLVVLNGAFMFASDLMKQIDFPCEISFVKVSSYSGTASRGQVDELIGLNRPVSGKEVVVLEDIVDTGLTMDKILQLLESHGASSVRLCTLLFKSEAFKGTRPPDIVGFEISNLFVVGYGLDYDEQGRNLNAIYQLKEV